MKSALITGINGQDGSYLAELLLSKGYEVHGTIKPSSIEDHKKLENISQIISDIHLHSLSIESVRDVYNVIKKIQPDECYHLAAQSFVHYSFKEENSIMATNFNSTINFLNSIKEICPTCRFYLAGSSEMFGEPMMKPQNEETPFNPKSIYGISKIASYFAVKNFREHGLFSCTGIAYNHESPRRGQEFVTRKITSTLAKIYCKKAKKITLGNLDAIRDWGYAPDYVQAMWLMLNKSDLPKDYVIATGETHSVRDFLIEAARNIGLNYEEITEINQSYFRPTERIPLTGNPSHIENELGWRRTKNFSEIVSEMIEHDKKYYCSN